MLWLVGWRASLGAVAPAAMKSAPRRLEMMDGPLNQIAVPIREQSTTDGSPVSCRLTSAAQTPPARVSPEIPSPWPIIPDGQSIPVTLIVDWASDPRHHQVAPS